MTKQETIKRIDEKLIELSNHIMNDYTLASERHKSYVNMLANAKIALCTKYEESEE